MAVSRLIFWLLVGGLAISALRRLGGDGSPRHSASGGRSPADAPRIESMVRCAQCGGYLPESEALRGQDGRWACCPEHQGHSG